MKKNEFPFPILCDTEGQLAKLFGAAKGSSKYAARITIVIDPDGKVAKVFEKVNPKDHPKAVLESLPEPKK